ncbi:dTDP-4-dehydrorhamnose reductase [Pseudomonas sp. PDM17]|uniref:dTDP-4-dehydrorhamnose reductase n=1 Tax=Pseudomonas sp. PDM17 TaxID=2769285 RepID=UPI00177D3584|nr:dTDP-4-dehydrorhamnose reductase [Pseudomonas sp. PDM17]MBD9503596.1 dTDP-4-dehydrorhamnose reductase [Pseudomonas sp. PDM17]
MKRILLFGANGQVGWELQRALAPLGMLISCDRAMADLNDIKAVDNLIAKIRPQFIVNAAAYTAVDKAESDEAGARRINSEAVQAMAVAAAKSNAWLVHYSTDYVFSGDGNSPYAETDVTGPRNIYGRTKLDGEEAIRASGCRHLIFRTSWVYAARGNNFAKTILRLASERTELKVIADQVGAPTSAELIADITALVLARLSQESQLNDKASGTYHLVAGGETSWYGFAQFIVKQALQLGVALTCPADQVLPISTAEYPLPAHRPANSRLSTRKLQSTFGVALPEWQHHAQRPIHELAGAIQ